MRGAWTRILTAAGAALVCLVAAPSAPAATGPHTETASSGGVTATLTYRMPSDYSASDVRLQITRDGAPVTLQGGADPAAGCKPCRNAIPVGGLEGDVTRSLTLADLDGNGEVEVIVDTFTGGAHCCSLSAIYGWDPGANQYRHLTHFWGDPGYVLKRLGTDPGKELVSADDRFAYAFCPYVCSAMPVLVFRYADFALVDVTKQFPLQMRRQDRRLHRTIRRLVRHKDQSFAIRGMYPALCANLYRLGHGGSCRRQLHSALRRGWLDPVPGDAGVWPGGRKYIRTLMRTLRKYGYT